jgi:drug/metabolite transporter (DMT)-like permease
MRTDGSSSYGDHAADEFEVEDIHSQSQIRRASLGPPPFTTAIEEKLGFNLWKLLRLFGVLTVGITIPALSWYSAVPLTSMADITTIYNPYAVWALVFSIWFLGEKWEKVS